MDNELEISSIKSIEDCLKNGNEEGKKECRICHVNISKKTFCLKRHFDRKHKDILKIIDEKQVRIEKKNQNIGTFLQEGKFPSIKMARLSQNKIVDLNKSLAIWISSDLHSFRSIESPAFRYVI